MLEKKLKGWKEGRNGKRKEGRKGGTKARKEAGKKERKEEVKKEGELMLGVRELQLDSEDKSGREVFTEEGYSRKHMKDKRVSRAHLRMENSRRSNIWGRGPESVMSGGENPRGAGIK